MIQTTILVIRAIIKRKQLKINYITIYITKINKILIIINKNQIGIKIIFFIQFESIINNLDTDKINNSLNKSGYNFNNNKFILGMKSKDIKSGVDFIFYNRMKSFELLDTKFI